MWHTVLPIYFIRKRIFWRCFIATLPTLCKQEKVNNIFLYTRHQTINQYRFGLNCTSTHYGKAFNPLYNLSSCWQIVKCCCGKIFCVGRLVLRSRSCPVPRVRSALGADAVKRGVANQHWLLYVSAYIIFFFIWKIALQILVFEN